MFYKSNSTLVEVKTILTDESEGQRCEPQISSKIARSVRALGYAELDYVLSIPI